jgi:hypothetical protein
MSADFQMSDSLLWEELKGHLDPAEVDSYARSIGLALISRNEDAFSELSALRRLQYTLNDTLSAEIERKNPQILASVQRSSAIHRAIAVLDSLRQQGHAIDPTCPDDAQVMKYLKLTRTAPRPNSGDRPISQSRALRECSKSARDFSQSFGEIRALLDEEYARIQNEIRALRCELFATADDLEDARQVQPPPTASIEQFNKRLQTQDFVIRSMAKTPASPVAKLRNSVHLNRLW